MLYLHHSSDFWPLGDKVEFDGENRLMIVHPEVTELDIRADVYSAWVRWRAMPVRGNSVYHDAMRYTGLDTIPGGQTGDTYFSKNLWKLVIDLTKVKLTGVLFSDDYPTAFYTPDLNPVYPATVSSLVMSSVSYQNVVTGDLSVLPSAAQTAAAVRTELLTELARMDASISSRLSAAGYTAPDNATIAAIAVKLAEAWGRLGLDPSKPLVTGQTQISFGDIVMAMTGDATQTTVTRAP